MEGADVQTSITCYVDIGRWLLCPSMEYCIGDVVLPVYKFDGLQGSRVKTIYFLASDWLRGQVTEPLIRTNNTDVLYTCSFIWWLILFCPKSGFCNSYMMVVARPQHQFTSLLRSPVLEMSDLRQMKESTKSVVVHSMAIWLDLHHH